MSNTYRLVDDGYATFKKIMNGRQWVGRVIKHADGSHYFARIGKTEAKGATEKEAFEEVVAKHLGHPNAATLHRKNRVVRRQVRTARAIQRALGNQILGELKQGRFGTLDKLGEKGGKTGGIIGLTAGLEALTREIKEGD